MKLFVLLLSIISVSLATEGRIPCNETVDCFNGRQQIGNCWKNFCIRPCRRQNACYEGTWCDNLNCYSNFCQHIDCPPLDIPDVPPVGRRLFDGFY